MTVRGGVEVGGRRGGREGSGAAEGESSQQIGFGSWKLMQSYEKLFPPLKNFSCISGFLSPPLDQIKFNVKDNRGHL